MKFAMKSVDNIFDFLQYKSNDQQQKMKMKKI